MNLKGFFNKNKERKHRKDDEFSESLADELFNGTEDIGLDPETGEDFVVEEYVPPIPKKKRLDAVVHETPLSAAVDVLNEFGEKLLRRTDGVDAWLCLDLDVDNNTVGGLSKKSQHNAVKGRLLERIDNNAIAIYASQELLDRNHMLILPIESTLEAMREFSILMTSDYEVVFLLSTGEIFHSGVSCKVSDVDNIVSGGVSIDEFYTELQTVIEKNQASEEEASPQAESEVEFKPVTQESVDEVVDAETPEAFQDESESNDGSTDTAVPAESDVYMDDAGSDAEVDNNQSVNEPVEETTVATEQIEQEVVSEEEPVTEYDTPSDTQPVEQSVEEPASESVEETPVDMGEPSFEEETEETPDPMKDDGSKYADENGNIDPAKSRDTMIHVFYPGDLKLEFDENLIRIRIGDITSYETFPIADDYDNPYIRRLNDLKRQANDDLAFRRKKMVESLSNKFTQVCAAKATEFSKLYSGEGEDSKFSRDYDAIKAEVEKVKNLKDANINEALAEIEKRYMEQRKEVMDQASLMAATDFDARQKAQRIVDETKAREKVANDTRLFEINSYRALDVKRRNYARDAFHAFTVQAVEDIVKDYGEFLQKEQEVYEKYRQDIENYIQSTREEDTAWTKVKAEEQMRLNEADEVRKEYAAKMDALMSETKSERERLEGVIAANEAQHSSYVDKISKEYEQRIATLETSETKHRQIAKESQEALIAAEPKIASRYIDRIDELQNDNESLAKRVDDMEDHKFKERATAIAIGSVLAIFALAAGLLGGMSIGKNASISDKQESVQIQQSLTKQIDSLNKRINELSAENGKDATNEKDTNSIEKKVTK